MSRPIRTVALLIAGSILIAGLVPAVAFAAVGPDDQIPGVPIAASPISGSLDPAIADVHNVSSISLNAGDRIEVSMTGSPGTDFDLVLYSPTATDVSQTYLSVASASTNRYPETFAYSVPTTGTYYLDVVSYGAIGGTYTMTWALVPAPAPDSDGVIPGVALPSSPVTSTLDGTIDVRDVYTVHLNAGERLSAELSGSSGTDYRMALFAPGSTSTTADAPVAQSSSGGYPTRMRYGATVAGDYYLEVRYFSGGPGTYRLDWSVAAMPPDTSSDIANAVPLTGPVVEGSVDEITDPHDVFSVYLVEGQTITLALTGDAFGDPDLRLFGPGSSSVLSSVPIAESATANRLESITLRAETTGVYFVDVSAYSGWSDYTLSWSKQLAPTVISAKMSSTSAMGARVTHSGTLKTDTGIPLAGRTVEVFSRAVGTDTWAAIGTVVTALDGSFSVDVRTMVPTDYQAVYAGDADYAPAFGPVLRLTPMPAGPPVILPDPATPVDLPASPVAGSLDFATNPSDVYRVTLQAGQTLTAQLSGAAGTDFDLYLYGPGAPLLGVTSPVASGGTGVYPRVAAYTATVPGDYYLHVWGPLAPSGDYTLTWSITTAGGGSGPDIAAAVPLTSSPVAGSFASGGPTRAVFSVQLAAGQALSASIDASAGVDAGLRLYGPATTSLDGTAAPLAETFSGSMPRALAFVAPTAGRYYVVVLTRAGAGGWKLAYSVADAASALTFTAPARVAWGGTATIAGQLTVAGAGRAGAAVDVFGRAAGTTAWRRVGTATTGAGGAFSLGVRPTRVMQYRVVFAGGDGAASAVSASRRTVAPYAYLTAPRPAVTAPAANKAFVVSGVLKPRHPNGARSVLVVGYRLESGRWVARRSVWAVNATTTTQTTYRARIALPAGKWKLVARVNADTLHAATTSAARYLTVR